MLRFVNWSCTAQKNCWGIHFMRSLPERAEGFKQLIDEVRLTGQPREIKEHAFSNAGNGQYTSGYMQVSYRPYEEADGQVSGVVIRCQDITEQMRSKAILEHALEQVRLAKKAAALGLFDVDLKQNLLEWDTRCRTLL